MTVKTRFYEILCGILSGSVQLTGSNASLPRHTETWKDRPSKQQWKPYELASDECMRSWLGWGAQQRSGSTTTWAPLGPGDQHKGHGLHRSHRQHRSESTPLHACAYIQKAIMALCRPASRPAGAELPQLHCLLLCFLVSLCPATRPKLMVGPEHAQGRAQRAEASRTIHGAMLGLCCRDAPCSSGRSNEQACPPPSTPPAHACTHEHTHP